MSEHPYREYEGSTVWECLNDGIADLAANADIKELTDRRYIVGYLAKRLALAGIVGPEEAGPGCGNER